MFRPRDAFVTARRLGDGKRCRPGNNGLARRHRARGGSFSGTILRAFPREEAIRQVLSELTAMATAARRPGALPGAPPLVPPGLGNPEIRRARLDVLAAYADASRREEHRACRRDAAARAQDMRRRARDDLAGAWSWFLDELDFLDLCWSDREKDASGRELVYLRVQRKATFGARWRQWRAACRAARGNLLSE